MLFSVFFLILLHYTRCLHQSHSPT